MACSEMVLIVDQKPTTGTQATSPGGSSSDVGSGDGSPDAAGSTEADGSLEDEGRSELALPESIRAHVS